MRATPSSLPSLVSSFHPNHPSLKTTFIIIRELERERDGRREGGKREKERGVR
jgi:hypothetical protein